MGELSTVITNGLGGGVLIYIVIEVLVFLITLWILYAVMKTAVKNAFYAARSELNYTIRQALLDSKIDMKAGVTFVPDYMIPEYSKDERIRAEEKKWKEQEKAERDNGNKPKDSNQAIG